MTVDGVCYVMNIFLLIKFDSDIPKMTLMMYSNQTTLSRSYKMLDIAELWDYCYPLSVN